MGKIEKILWERFGNILKRSFKCHRNSEYSCYRHNWLISKENNKSGNAVLSHSGLIPLELGKKKEGDCFGRLRERRICLTYVGILSLLLLYVICSTLHTLPTFAYTSWRVPPPSTNTRLPKVGKWLLSGPFLRTKVTARFSRRSWRRNAWGSARGRLLQPRHSIVFYSCPRVIVSHVYPYYWESNCKGILNGYRIHPSGCHRGKKWYVVEILWKGPSDVMFSFTAKQNLLYLWETTSVWSTAVQTFTPTY